MDLVPSVKEKLNYFRIKELKDVLTQLHLSKQGKKQDLVDRILSVLSDEQVSKMWAKKNAGGKEQVAKLVDDTYRKMQISGATDLASKGQGASDSSSVKVKSEFDDAFQRDVKIRCLCGSRLETEDLVKCDDPRCHVWQHISCVIIPEKPTEGIPPVPDKFYCELCRLTRADPFWVSVAHPLHPVKLTTTSNPTDGNNPVQSVERTFQLTRADMDLVSKPEFDVEAWCMLLNDKVPFRMQWPQYTDLQVNGVPVRATNRPGSQLLGANGRDDGPIITPYTKDGINKISLTGCDARIFCLGVRIVKRRSMQQILNSIPKESDGEKFEEALARVCRCVGGGNAADDADSDSDLEVVSDTFTINLRCPMSGSRMKIAGRFKPCIHMGCFDLEVFVEMNQRSRKWQCPICLKNYALENIIIDPYFNRITSMMMNCGEEIAEIEVKPDGSWRVKVKSESERLELGNLAQWRLPDGTLCVSTDGDVKRVDTLKQVKQEGVSDSPAGLKLGIKKNCNGVWEVSKPEGTNTSSGNNLKRVFGNPEQVVIPMSSSATGSGRDGDDPSVNQGGGGHIDYSTTNGIEMDSLCLNNVDLAYEYTAPNTSAQVGGAEVIVLSDSEEDNDLLASPAIAYKNNRNDATDGYSVPPPVIVDSYTEDHNLGGNSCLGLFPNDDDFGMSSLWPLPSGSQAGPGFQLFGSDADVSDALVHLQHGPMNCSSSLNGYALAPDTALGSGGILQESSAGRSVADLNGGLVDNPLAFGGDDPSFQIFLPTRPADSSMHNELRDQANVANGVCTEEDWISLRLGGGAGGNNGDAPTQNGLNSRHQIPTREGAKNTLDDTASLLLGMNDVRSDRARRQRSDSPFSFPRQKRSVRPRLYLSIDSDSE
ncbi:E3 SUMO-protein ligase SIZ1-like [Glycine soja]|uniref:E3 SUMO-protein ligase SIZ1 n=1 Tax=Glycine soja TaxID=3848 RepID=A0A445I1U9_GLYSO|nr:E3 SUMO-protein ligase SIZ1-like [Glycine soja]XP_028187281.1 E3 SUMO-protein ligase SIZ1-like [Glycine soja]KHN22049.1 E3 SUMO-protein ligase SIZ1 [Glycine soja]RZB80043.1 E3 SUMO-protein ligase SIZ1 isoform A [Glycine soja]RZB80044.1 E3 SUMO-protein ligase SIZ1 isoform B [Glycine soja]|eukprot:NP_001340428.1 SUMO E3 ligase SIZ1b [Glycine max]